MVSSLYILFILVMTHALEALPFSGPDYYGSTFHKLVSKGNTNKKVHKPMYSVMDPTIFQKKMITKLPVKGFMKGFHPLLTPPLFEKLPFSKMKLGMSSLVSSPFNNDPFFYFKSSILPSQKLSKQSKLTDLKDSKRIPNIYELTFENQKPNKPPDIKTDLPYDIIVNSKQMETRNEQFPNLDNAKIITIDIVKRKELPPATIVQPTNGKDNVDVFRAARADLKVKSDVRNVGPFGVTIVEFENPDKKEISFVDNAMQDNAGQSENTPAADISIVQGVSSVDSNGEIQGVISNQDIITGQIANEIEASAEKLLPNNVITIGDIPGFIADGGISVEASTEPIYDVASEIQRREQGIDLVNDVMVTRTGTLNLNAKDLLPIVNRGNFAISEHLNANGILDVGIESAADPGNLIAEGSAGNILVGDSTDISILDNNVGQRLQTFEVGVNDFVVSNDISLNVKPLGNVVDHTVNMSKENVPTTKLDNHRIGSVAIIRPVSFDMKVEPFGPGPYGQCREPSRVVCGARFGWEHVTGMVEWCKLNCIVYMYSSYCDDDRCQCKCV